VSWLFAIGTTGFGISSAVAYGTNFNKWETDKLNKTLDQLEISLSSNEFNAAKGLVRGKLNFFDLNSV